MDISSLPTYPSRPRAITATQPSRPTPDRRSRSSLLLKALIVSLLVFSMGYFRDHIPPPEPLPPVINEENFDEIRSAMLEPAVIRIFKAKGIEVEEPAGLKTVLFKHDANKARWVKWTDPGNAQRWIAVAFYEFRTTDGDFEWTCAKMKSGF